MEWKGYNISLSVRWVGQKIMAPRLGYFARDKYMSTVLQAAILFFLAVCMATVLGL